MFDGTIACWNPTWAVTMERKPRLLIAKFGDGYEQRTIEGLNPMETRWMLTWSMRPRDVLVDMDSFLTTRYGAAFDFLDPTYEVVVPVFCDQWTVTWVHKGFTDEYGDLAAEFRRAHGVAIASPALP